MGIADDGWLVTCGHLRKFRLVVMGQPGVRSCQFFFVLGSGDSPTRKLSSHVLNSAPQHLTGSKRNDKDALTFGRSLLSGGPLTTWWLSRQGAEEPKALKP